VSSQSFTAVLIGWTHHWLPLLVEIVLQAHPTDPMTTCGLHGVLQNFMADGADVFGVGWLGELGACDGREE